MKLEIFLVLVLGLVNGARILVWPAEWSHWINMKVRLPNPTQLLGTTTQLAVVCPTLGTSAQPWPKIETPKDMEEKDWIKG